MPSQQAFERCVNHLYTRHIIELAVHIQAHAYGRGEASFIHLSRVLWCALQSPKCPTHNFPQHVYEKKEVNFVGHGWGGKGLLREGRGIYLSPSAQSSKSNTYSTCGSHTSWCKSNHPTMMYVD